MPTSFEDHLAIRELSARYNLAADTADLDGYADCFTDDGEFEVGGVASLKGRDQLKALIGALDFPTHHISADSIVEVDGDRATQVCSFVLYGRVGEENAMRSLTTARYRDELVRTPDGWRFARRVVTPDNDLGRMLAEVHPPMVQALAALAG